MSIACTKSRKRRKLEGGNRRQTSLINHVGKCSLFAENNLTSLRELKDLLQELYFNPFRSPPPTLVICIILISRAMECQKLSPYPTFEVGRWNCSIYQRETSLKAECRSLKVLQPKNEIIMKTGKTLASHDSSSTFT